MNPSLFQLVYIYLEELEKSIPAKCSVSLTFDGDEKLTLQVWVKLKGRVKVLERVFLPQELYEIKCGKGFDDYILEYFRFKFLESLEK